MKKVLLILGLALGIMLFSCQQKEEKQLDRKQNVELQKVENKKWLGYYFDSITFAQNAEELKKLSEGMSENYVNTLVEFDMSMVISMKKQHNIPAGQMKPIIYDESTADSINIFLEKMK